MSDISQFLQTVKLPVMPEVAQALIRTLNDGDADVPTVRKIIAKDPALTATLMRMANSAIFGLSRSVETLDNAISVVGMTQIRARALSICMSQVFKFPPSMSRLEFWRNSMACAGYAKWLAGHAGVEEQSAWLTGVMLRLGELPIADKRLGALEEIERMPRLPGERWSRERTEIGFDEGQITAEMARRWDFPDAMTAGLQSAAQPMIAKPFSRLAAVVHVAAWLADLPPDTVDPLSQCPHAVLMALGLNLETLAAELPSLESLNDISTLHN
jgi:HD-like signal output (HDOD) protein